VTATAPGVLSGSSRTAVSAEEAEPAWRFVDPVLQEWADGGVPLAEYPAGSAGPAPLP
jgi:glucose-6-phosphate 1-dehydrogenase